MTITRLILREIGHRKVNFVLAVLAVMVAVASLLTAQAWMSADRWETGRLLAAKQAELETSLTQKREAVAKAGKDLEDSVRKQMLGLGFNVLILPAEQDLSELHLSGGLSATMPESYVDKLAASSVVTVNHLLPSVTRRINWSERNMDVILVGTRGEVPIMHRGLKKPMLEAVAPGKMVVGFDVARKAELSVGDVVTLMDREFTISTVHAQRTSEDDVTIWVDLRQAQEMLGLENLIHAILALECGCAGDRISVIREEIAGVLPGTQVVERYSRALTRAESRAKAKASAEAALAREAEAAATLMERETASRRAQETRRASLASVIVPLVIAGSAVLIGLLSFLNVRQRRSELGILRAIGLTGRQILATLLGKAVLVGLLGGVLGCLASLLIIRVVPKALTQDSQYVAEVWSSVIYARPLLTAFLLAPLAAVLLSGLASWLPALVAVQEDPALTLQGE